jgi:hypothetical protein
MDEMRGKYLTVSCNKPLKINNLGKKWKKTKKSVARGGGLCQSLFVVTQVAAIFPSLPLLRFTCGIDNLGTGDSIKFAIHRQRGLK